MKFDNNFLIINYYSIKYYQNKTIYIIIHRNNRAQSEYYNYKQL